MRIKIRRLEGSDWEAVANIYRLGLETGNASFETEVPDYNTWDKKFRTDQRWVAITGDEIVGWAGLMPVSVRKVYEGVTEVSIYVHPMYYGRRIGTYLMSHVIEQSELAGIWTLFASIFPENEASHKLHVSSGFRLIGYRERIAKLHGTWRDTHIYERRSKIVGL